MITSASLHDAIVRVHPALLTGRSGYRLIHALPDVALALSAILGEVCQDCGAELTPDTARAIGDRILCAACVMASITHADRATPCSSFMGSGQRVIRKTGGLS